MSSLINILIYLISILFTFFLGFLVYINKKEERINRFFFFAILCAVGWLTSLFLFYSIESPEIVLWIGRFNFAIVLPLLYFLFKFSLVFPREVFSTGKIFDNFLKVWILIFTFITLLTPLVGKEEIITGPSQRETLYGPLYPLYVLHYIIFFIIIASFLFYKLKKSKDITERYQIRYVLIGLTIALLFGFITNILLPLFGLFEAQNYGPLATVIFTGFLSIAILRHHLFDIKVIATEIFVLSIIFLLFLNIFIPYTILNILIFFGSIIFGTFLIKGVILELKAKEELKRTDKAKSDFLAMASHQLRTPLTAIKGYISLLEEGAYGNLSEKIKKVVNNIGISTNRLTKIVDDLLTVSKIEMGRLTAEKKAVQIEELLESVIEELKPRVKEKKLKITFEKPKEPLPKIKIDPLKIHQVIYNLIDNAIRYTQKGGITIKAEKKDNEILRISVKDTGEGLTKEEKETIFESFIRGKAGTAFFIEGTGLGLHVAKRYLELHQGKIWAESEGKGKGSTFYVELPIR
jgi:signal transduction histidine kinase